MISRNLPRDSRSCALVLFWLAMVGCAPATRYANDGPTESPTIQTLAKTEARPSASPTRPPRPRALLVTEIQLLEELASQTPERASDRAQLLRRIAEDYVELERAAHNDGVARVVTEARAKAIKAYALLATDHPDYPANDEVLFYLATEYEQSADLRNARKAYFELIQKAPESRYVPEAYLAFGEMFFDEGARDPSKWDLALAAYRKVLAYPPPRNRVYGYACYKLAWVLENQGDRAGAIEAFNRAITFSTEYATLSGSAKLGDAARVDIAALEGEPSNATHDDGT